MRRNGTVLVLVLIVIVILTLAALTFSKLMFAENKGAVYSLRQRQVRLIAESGIESLRITLMKEPETLDELGGLYDNEELFRGYLVTDGTVSMTGASAGITSGNRSVTDPRDVGRFSVIAPGLADDGTLCGDAIRYGLTDESTKLNLRWLIQAETQIPGIGRQLLTRLPGVTEETADALLDWLDEDSDPREYGAEDDYYATLDPPYYAKNGIPDSLDELLLVKGITPALLYGIDWNRNGLLDLGEPDESTLEEYGAENGALNLGLLAYLTLDSRESNIDPATGEAKVNINMSDTAGLKEALAEVLEDEELIDYIVAYREENEKVNSLLDLVGGSVGEGDNVKESPLDPEDFEMLGATLPLLYDALSLSDQPVVGRININQAPRNVLMLFVSTEEQLQELQAATGIDSQAAQDSANGNGADTTDTGTTGATGGLTAEETLQIIEDILAERISDPSLANDAPEMRYPFWPYTHGIVTDFEKMKQLEPYFCTQGAVFKAQVVSRFDEQSPSARLEVWLDATDPLKPATVLRVRELTDLGPGFPGSLLGIPGESDTRTTGNR